MKIKTTIVVVLLSVTFLGSCANKLRRLADKIEEIQQQANSESSQETQLSDNEKEPSSPTTQAKNIKPASKVEEIKPIYIDHNPKLPKIKLVISSLKMGASGKELSDLGLLSTKITAQLTTALTRVRNFSVIDREAADDIQKEMNASEASTMSLGDYVIRATLTEFTQEVRKDTDKSSVNLKSVGKLMGFAGATNAETLVNIAQPTYVKDNESVTGAVKLDLKVVQVPTGEIASGIEAKGSFTSAKGAKTFGLFGITDSHSEFTKSSLGQATRDAMNSAAKQLYSELEQGILKPRNTKK